MIFARSCGLTSAAVWLADLLRLKKGNLRQQLREWCYDAADKHGEQRQELEVRTCFAPLLQWVLSWWTPSERRLALAMDVSVLADRFTVLCICVVYRGCAIPVA